MKILILIISYVTITNFAFAQYPNLLWAKSIGYSGTNPQLRNTAKDAADNVYNIIDALGGTLDVNPDPVIQNLLYFPYNIGVVQKINTNGELVWALNINYATSIFVDKYNNLLILGDYHGTVDVDPSPNVFNLTSVGGGDNTFLVKLDSAGNFIWAKNFEFEIPYGGNKKFCTTDTSNNIFLSARFSGSVDVDPSANIYTISSLGGSFILKMDSNANFIWAKILDGGAYINHIIVDNSNSIYISGAIVGNADIDPSSNVYNLDGQTCLGSTYPHPFIVNLNDTGDFIWGQLYGNSCNYGECKIIKDTDDNLYVTANSNYLGAIDFDLGTGVVNLPASINANGTFLAKYDSNNILIWVKEIKDIGYNYFLTDNQSNIYLTGLFSGSEDFDPGSNVYNLQANGYSDLFILKLNNMGDFVWVTQLGEQYNTIGTGIGTSTAFSILLDNNNQVYGVGDFKDTVDFDPTPSIFNISDIGISDIFFFKYGCINGSVHNLNSCNNYFFNNQSLTTSGTYYDTLANANGCDSIITLNLTINTPTSNILNQTSCNSYFFNNQTLTLSGTYYDTLVNSTGCDSIISLNLTINNPNNTITQSGATLTANAFGATYQWVNCASFSIIPNETNQSYTATTNGDYALIITQNGCKDTSVCVTVSGVGFSEIPKESFIQISPNPTNGKMQIERIGKPFSNATIQIVTPTGNKVYEKKHVFANKYNINISSFASGIYFMVIYNEQFEYKIKVVKE